MQTHELKTWPEYFWAISLEGKTFEIRENDRGFKQGDTLLLREWSPASKRYSGVTLKRVVTYILYDYEHDGIAKGYCIMSTAPVPT